MSIETVEYRGYRIEIYPDESAENPRDWDNLWTMFCFHSRYMIGDPNPYRSQDFYGWKDLFHEIQETYKAALILPLYLYDHSGTVLASAPFQCGWDSGQIGYAFVEREKLLREYGKKRFTNALAEKAIKVLDSEIEVYNQWSNGDVYEYSVYDEKGDWVDGCSNFYGLEYCIGEAKNSVDYHRQEAGLLTIS